jgi:hypothetical protein
MVTDNKNQDAKELVFYIKQVAVVKATVRVRAVKETDFGTRRYFKEFFKQLVNEPEARTEFFKLNYVDRYLNESDEVWNTLPDMPQDEHGYILTTAAKCGSEVQAFCNAFIFPKINRENKPQKNHTAQNGEEVQLHPNENEQFFSLLNTHLTALDPISLEFFEMTPVEISQLKGRNKGEPVKT